MGIALTRLVENTDEAQRIIQEQERTFDVDIAMQCLYTQFLNGFASFDRYFVNMHNVMIGNMKRLAETYGVLDIGMARELLLSLDILQGDRHMQGRIEFAKLFVVNAPLLGVDDIQFTTYVGAHNYSRRGIIYTSGMVFSDERPIFHTEHDAKGLRLIDSLHDMQREPWQQMGVIYAHIDDILSIVARELERKEEKWN